MTVHVDTAEISHFVPPLTAPVFAAFQPQVDVDAVYDPSCHAQMGF
jgi:hypothetical protein